MTDEGDLYELSGTDYVMDVIGETELPPGFPAGRGGFMVSERARGGSRKVRMGCYWDRGGSRMVIRGGFRGGSRKVSKGLPCGTWRVHGQRACQRRIQEGKQRRPAVLLCPGRYGGFERQLFRKAKRVSSSLVILNRNDDGYSEYVRPLKY